MALLILGLIVFLGLHSVRIFASDWRNQRISAMGAGPWKGVYSLVSIAALVCIVFGYGLAREAGGQVFDPPAWSRTALLLAMPFALILFVASNLPAGYIKFLFRHPLLVATIVWAALHVIGNGDTATVLLAGGFLIWAVVDLWSASRRAQKPIEKKHVWSDLVSIAVGLALTWAFVAFLHEWLVGVPVT